MLLEARAAVGQLFSASMRAIGLLSSLRHSLLNAFRLHGCSYA